MAADALGGLAFWILKWRSGLSSKIPLPEGLKSSCFGPATKPFWPLEMPEPCGVGNPVAQGLQRVCDFKVGEQMIAAYDLASEHMIFVSRESKLVVLEPSLSGVHPTPIAIQQMRVSDDGALLACLVEGERIEFIDVYAEKQFPALQPQAAVSTFYPHPANSRFIFRDGSRWRQSGTELTQVSTGEN